MLYMKTTHLQEACTLHTQRFTYLVDGGKIKTLREPAMHQRFIYSKSKTSESLLWQLVNIYCAHTEKVAANR